MMLARSILQSLPVCVIAFLGIIGTANTAPLPMPMYGGGGYNYPAVQSNFFRPNVQAEGVTSLRNALNRLQENPSVYPYEIVDPGQRAEAAAMVDSLIRAEGHMKKFLFLGPSPNGGRYAFMLPDREVVRDLLGNVGVDSARMALITVRRHDPAHIHLNGFVGIDGLQNRNVFLQRILGADIQGAFSHDLESLFRSRINGF